MFEKFSDRARAAMTGAREEAAREESPRIEEAHLLIGLIEEGRGLAARTLSRIVDAERLVERARRSRAFKGTPFGSMSSRGFGYSLGAKEALEGALRVAGRFGHEVVGTGYLLVSLLERPDGPATKLVAEAAGSATAVRTEAEKALAEEPGEYRGLPVHMNPVDLWNEAHRRGCPAVSREHLLLGLLRMESVRDLLRRLGAEPAAIAARLASGAETSDVVPGTVTMLPLEASVLDVMQRAEVIALLAERDAVEAPHVLLAILADEACPEREILEASGVMLSRLRSEVFRVSIGPAPSGAGVP